MDLKKLFIFNNSFIYITNTPLINEFHSHYAISLLVSWPHPFTLINENGVEQNCQFVTIGSNTKHRILSKNTNLLVAQWDPYELDFLDQSSWIRRGSIHILSWQRIEPFRAQMDALLMNDLPIDKIQEIYKNLQSTVGTRKRIPSSLDIRIRRVCDFIYANLLENLNVKVLANLANLSETRFMHLFKDEMGIPVRRYVLWQRLFHAAKQMQKGKTLIESAYEAGFSDQAHLSRTFKDMLGVQPSLFLGGQSGVLVKLCE